MLIVLIVGFISYFSSTDALKRQSHDIINQYQRNTVEGIRRNINRYEILANTIHSNTGIQRLISYNYVDPYSEFMTIRTLVNPKLWAILYASETGMNIQLIRYNDLKSEIIPSNIENLLDHVRFLDYHLDDGRRQFQILNYARVMDLLWFQEIRSQMSGYVWTQVGHDGALNYISLLHEITDISTFTNEPVGMLRLTIPFYAIHHENMRDSDKHFTLVFNDQDELLSGEPEVVSFYYENSDFLRSLQNTGTGTLHFTQELILLKSEPFNNGWYIICVFPAGYITDNINRITFVTTVSLILAGILLFLLTSLISSSFSKRIKIIAKQLQHFKSGNFDAKIINSGHDEISYLGEAFNDMSEQIATLIQDNYQSNIDKKEALLKALQAQINPHFLYNSLSTVGRLAELGETGEIINIIYALARFYRLTLNNGREIITVGDELKQVEAYLEVFRIRKGEAFTVTYNIDEDALKYYTIKVILQPFVENIFEHAMRLGDSIINIHISIQLTDNDIVFTIKDDGVGIPPEKIGNLLEVEKQESYGIGNVNERINLQFGTGYGVNIESDFGFGTVVTVIIPRNYPLA